MVDAWLLIVTIVGSILMLALNIYLFLQYSHPDDNKDIVGWIGWVVVVAGSTIVWGLVLLLPLDVANSRGDGGGLNMYVLYQLLFIL